jgi:hypothetical protein
VITGSSCSPSVALAFSQLAAATCCCSAAVPSWADHCPVVSAVCLVTCSRIAWVFARAAGGAVETGGAVGGHLRLQRRLIQAHAVALDRVHLALERRGEGLDGVGGGAAEHRGHVRALLDQALGGGGGLGHGHAGVLHLRADDRGHLLVLALGQPDGRRRTLRGLGDDVGVAAEHRLDRPGGLLQIRGGVEGLLAQRGQPGQRPGRRNTGLVQAVLEPFDLAAGLVQAAGRTGCVTDDIDRQGGGPGHGSRPLHERVHQLRIGLENVGIGGQQLVVVAGEHVERDPGDHGQHH